MKLMRAFILLLIFNDAPVHHLREVILPDRQMSINDAFSLHSQVLHII